MMCAGWSRALVATSIAAVAGVGPMACKPAGSGGSVGGGGAAGGGADTGAAATTPTAGAGAATGTATGGGASATATTGRSLAAPEKPKSSTPITVTSSTFQSEATMPKATVFNGCGGSNTSPQLAWSGAPPETKSFVVTLFDPDAPTSTGFWHWVVYNIPASVTTLPAGAGSSATPVKGAGSGFADFGFNHYGGPCPPNGDPPHHYIFTVYALDVPKMEGAGPHTTGAVAMFSLRGHLLAEGSLEGLFGR